MKERLTGAIILVVVVVLLVPELLSGPARSVPPAQPALPTSSSEEAPLRSYTINLQDDAHAAGAGTVSTPAQSSGPAQPTPIAESSSADPASPQAATENSPTQTDASSSVAAPPATTPPPSENPAPPSQTVAPPAQHSPPPAAPQRSVAPEKPAPAQQHNAAADGRPADRHPVEHSSAAERSESSGAAGGWMVQLGVFSVQANAERLAQELKSQGFHSLVSQVGSAGRPLWRVRAGPVAEHAAAEQLSARLRAAGHAGSVVPK